MKIVYLYYVEKPILLLLISESDDYFVGFRSNLLSKSDINLVRKNVDLLDNLKSDELYKWFKKNIPSSIKAFRKLLKNKCKIIRVENVRRLDG